MGIPNIMYGTRGNEKNVSTVATAQLGQLMVLADGRKFRYAKNGAAAAGSAGLLFQGPLSGSSEASSALVIEAAAVGDRHLHLSSVTTAVAADAFLDGYALVLTSITGGGYLYPISTHAALSTATVTTNSIYLNTGIESALTSAAKVSLHRNPFNGVIVHPSPPTAMVRGWTQSSAAASAFFWLGTAGPTGALADGTLQLNQNVTPSTALDGAVGPAYLRLVSATSAVAFTSGAPTSLTFTIANSGGAESIGAFASAAAVSSVAGDIIDIGMQQTPVGICMSTGGYSSGEYALVWAGLEG